jgi:ubiquinone/menaquinone biosynthesis C-methylase UbiE
MLDRHECYELCVQSPRHVVTLLRGIHGNLPTRLREDFCGTAAVGIRWCAEADARGEAASVVGVDLDPTCLERAKRHAREAGVLDRMTLRLADALSTTAGDEPADVVFVGNFSIGYIHERRDLVAYLTRCHTRLRRGQGGFGGGVFVCDLYGGASAFRLGGLERRHPGRRGETIHYAWSHDRADPRTGMVENSISFRVEFGGEIVAEHPRAFVYRWRLWSLPEMRDAMLEAGFARSAVFTDLNPAPGVPPTPAEQLPEDFIVAVAAYTEA